MSSDHTWLLETWSRRERERGGKRKIEGEKDEEEKGRMTWRRESDGFKSTQTPVLWFPGRWIWQNWLSLIIFLDFTIEETELERDQSPKETGNSPGWITKLDKRRPKRHLYRVPNGHLDPRCPEVRRNWLHNGTSWVFLVYVQNTLDFECWTPRRTSFSYTSGLYFNSSSMTSTGNVQS